MPRISRFLSITLTCCILFLDGIRAQYDGAENYCKRIDHQSAVANGYLYIDGGIEWFHDPKSNHSEYVGINDGLITTSMQTGWDWKKNIKQKVIEKVRGDSDVDDYVPSLVRGALWQNKNETALYFYGGTVENKTTAMRLYGPAVENNDTFVNYVDPVDDKPNLWKFDIKTEKWSPVTPAQGSADNIIRLSDGAGVVAPETNKAYYFGGQLDAGSTPDTFTLPTPRFTPGLLEFDFETEIVRNLSTQDITGSRAIANAQMVFLPNYGRDGSLLLIGGERKSNEIVDLGTHWRGDPNPMESITIYDIADQTWYTQSTTNAVGNYTPPVRTDHCLVAMPAPDLSSYNIYMYGGWNDHEQLDDIWVLSIPSFKWIEIFTGRSPRYGHTCHVVGKRQMITVGGVGDYFDTNTSACDWESKSVAIYDLTTLQWGSTFNHDDDEYGVPVEIWRVIGGNKTGFANKTSPKNGWDQPGLEVLLMNPNNVTHSMPVASPEKKSRAHPGAIIGGVIAGVAIIALIILGAFFFVRRRRNAGSAAGVAELDTSYYRSSKSELEDGQRRVELDSSPTAAYGGRFSAGRMPVPEIQEMQAERVERPPQELPGDYEWVTDRKSAATTTTTATSDRKSAASSSAPVTDGEGQTFLRSP